MLHYFYIQSLCASKMCNSKKTLLNINGCLELNRKIHSKDTFLLLLKMQWKTYFIEINYTLLYYCAVSQQTSKNYKSIRLIPQPIMIPTQHEV